MESKMIEEISEIKVTQALIVQRQDQTDKVIEKLSDTLVSLSSKVTKGFYIALGVILMASGSITDVGKLMVKFIGG